MGAVLRVVRGVVLVLLAELTIVAVVAGIAFVANGGHVGPPPHTAAVVAWEPTRTPGDHE